MDVSIVSKATGSLNSRVINLLTFSYLGIDQPALRLLIGLLSSYVFAWVYKHFVLGGKVIVKDRNAVTMRHLYNFLAGLALVYINYGFDVVHLLIPTVLVWSTLRIGGSSVVCVGFSCALAFGYLMVGYYHNQVGDDYVLDWTTSYCVMALRLMGFAMDYYDGGKKQKESISSKISGLDRVWSSSGFKELPSLIETLGYVFFYGGVLVGPQFPFNFYLKHVTMESFKDNIKNGEPIPSCGTATFNSFIMGIGYMIATQVGKLFFPTAYCISAEYLNQPFWWKVAYMTVSGRFALTKYLGVWCVGEGACILSGLSFNGFSDQKKALWNGLSNVDPYIYETMTSLSEVISSFNMNTNMWSKNYVFKRMRFLNSKPLSAISTLIFLAIWHGFAPGYFGAFTLEFLDIQVESRFKQWFKPLIDSAFKPGANVFWKGSFSMFCYLLSNACLSYAMIAFDLLSWNKISVFWSSQLYWNHIAVVSILLLAMVIPKSSSKKGKSEKKEAAKEE
ncbi:hypothetical protein MP638_001258 [Amoeboaphelidium occidentale]|nr:hypothetical protein MP638_001258 [Amoeboaphelidium occidentale]